jgi:bacterioferritin-associated ferredoxin
LAQSGPYVAGQNELQKQLFGWDFAFMIVCSCNVLSDEQVRQAVTTTAPRNAGQVYGCLGCSAQCGRCARTIRKIMDEALGAPVCPAGCACAAHARAG